MSVKIYIVAAKANPNIFYEVAAPCKRVARWCGANLADSEYPGFRTARDMIARRVD